MEEGRQEKPQALAGQNDRPDLLLQFLELGVVGFHKQPVREVNLAVLLVRQSKVMPGEHPVLPE